MGEDKTSGTVLCLFFLLYIVKVILQLKHTFHVFALYDRNTFIFGFLVVQVSNCSAQEKTAHQICAVLPAVERYQCGGSAGDAGNDARYRAESREWRRRPLRHSATFGSDRRRARGSDFRWSRCICAFTQQRIRRAAGRPKEFALQRSH